MSDAQSRPAIVYRGLNSVFLRKRELDGSYPFRSHRTCAEWMPPATGASS